MTYKCTEVPKGYRCFFKVVEWKTSVVRHEKEREGKKKGLSQLFKGMGRKKHSAEKCLEISLKIKHSSLQIRSEFIKDLVIIIPVACPPSDDEKLDVFMALSNGKAQFSAKEKAIIWKLRKLSAKEYSLNAHIPYFEGMEEMEMEGKDPPKMRIEFTGAVVNFSGLRLLRCDVKHEKPCIKWINYRIENGLCEVFM